MSLFQDLLGTTRSFFRVGIKGFGLKSGVAGLAVRNTGDAADGALTASTVNVSGDALVINSDAAGTGADWTYTINRPASGMAANLTLNLPANAGSPGQVLSTDGSGNLSFASAGNTASSLKDDTTTLAFGATSPVAMFSIGATDVVKKVQLIIDTPFNGTPSVSIGTGANTSKYVSATDIDLSQPAGTVFDISPGLPAPGAAESLIATYAAGDATAGSARVLVSYATPA